MIHFRYLDKLKVLFEEDFKTALESNGFVSARSIILWLESLKEKRHKELNGKGGRPYWRRVLDGSKNP